MADSLFDTTDLFMEDSNLETDQSAIDDSMDAGQDGAGDGAATGGATDADDQVYDATEDDADDSDDGTADPNQTFTTQGVPKMGNVPTPKYTSGSIPRTRFADEYRSTLTLEAKAHATAVLPLLTHVNCSYLSSYGIAPTLTELKQHAQSIIVLIKNLTVSTNAAFIDNRNLQGKMNDAASFHDGETYDFLNDLTKHYDGPTTPELLTHHSMPLNAALNTVEIAQVIPVQTACACAASKQAPMPITGLTPLAGHNNPNATTRGIPAHEILRDICPLHSSFYTPINGPSLPYAQHQALISHANEVLELLDHEYSAKGGLLSILPPKEQVEDRKLAETTLLGQLILYMQRLVQRVHDLERLYANATDALASEAVVPSQALSRLGPDGRKGRELVYPQDRFVLVNAGEDLFNFLSYEFDKKDITDELVMKNNKKFGTTGEAVWQERGGREFSRGITAIDVVTRYYRIRGNEKEGRGIKTIFIIPAHAEHPGVAVTREMEKQPTVVSVVKPVWPERQSIWEMKNRSDLQDLKILQRENQRLKDEKEIDDNKNTLATLELELKRAKIRKLQSDVEDRDIALKKPENAAKDELFKKHVTVANKKEEDADKIRRQNEADREATKAARAESETLRNQLRDQAREYEKNLAALRKQDAAERAARTQQLREADERAATVAAELEQKLKAVWQKQIKETQVIIEFLKAKKVDVGNATVPTEIEKLGNKNGEQAFNNALSESATGFGSQTWLYPPNNTDPDAMSEAASGFSYEGESGDDQSMYDCCAR